MRIRCVPMCLLTRPGPSARRLILLHLFHRLRGQALLLQYGIDCRFCVRHRTVGAGLAGTPHRREEALKTAEESSETHAGGEHRRIEPQQYHLRRHRPVMRADRRNDHGRNAQLVQGNLVAIFTFVALQ